MGHLLIRMCCSSCGCASRSHTVETVHEGAASSDMGGCLRAARIRRELELRKLLFDKSKSRRRICASVYNYATTKWDPQRAQVNDIYIENKKQRAERKRLALSNYHQATRLLKRRRTARRIPDEVLPWLPCEHSLIYSCVRFRSFLRQSNSKPPHQSCCVPSRGKGPAMAWWARVL
jgi:hypothetical protein